MFVFLFVFKIYTKPDLDYVGSIRDGVLIHRICYRTTFPDFGFWYRSKIRDIRAEEISGRIYSSYCP
jgi:hypothetical protein